LNGIWVPKETRDQAVDTVEKWSKKSGVGVGQFIKWLGIGRSKYYDWKRRYGQENHHNAPTPRTFWLEGWEQEAIIAFYAEHPDEGYRRMAYMMLDADVVAVSPSSVYRVLKKAGVLKKWANTASRKGKGFHQPEKPHQHWHIDIAYINICGTFYYLCSILDGYSRYVVHWEIRESMTEADVEVIIERAREKFPEAKARVISDNGPQFVAKSFKEYIRFCGMTHVRTAPFYPQSNGKIERWHKSLKTECIRPQTPLSLEDARRVVDQFVRCYNTERLHSAIGYVTPEDKLKGRETAIFAERKCKLANARQRRALHWRQAGIEPTSAHHSVSPSVGVAYAG
jgi:putative transposase